MYDTQRTSKVTTHVRRAKAERKLSGGGNPKDGSTHTQSTSIRVVVVGGGAVARRWGRLGRGGVVSG